MVPLRILLWWRAGPPQTGRGLVLYGSDGQWTRLQRRVKGALQLRSKRHKQIRFAHVHERVLLLRSVELLTAITSDLTMKSGRTRNKRLTESKLKP